MDSFIGSLYNFICKLSFLKPKKFFYVKSINVILLIISTSRVFVTTTINLKNSLIIQWVNK